jgi:hypothetical protein
MDEMKEISCALLLAVGGCAAFAGLVVASFWGFVAVLVWAFS